MSARELSFGSENGPTSISTGHHARTELPDAAPERVRVAMLTNLFHPVASGSANHVRDLSRALSREGHHVVVITARVDSSPAHEVIDGVDVYRVPAIRMPRMSITLNFPWINWTFWPANLRRVEAILCRHEIKILHIHNHMFDMALIGEVMRRRLRLPLVLTLHTVIKHANKLFNVLLYPADRLFLRWLVVRNADKVICPDVNISSYLEEAFGRTDGALIPYGITLPPHPGPEIKAQIEKRFGLRGRRVILSLGHVHALRNRLDLIRAMVQVQKQFPDVLLLIVGVVADQRPVALAKELGLDRVVLFASDQPHAHISAYHELAEIEAMWLDQADGGQNPLGIACMEAMLAGRPVLTLSNIDTFGQGVLEDGRDVIIVDANDPVGLAGKICSLLEDPQRVQRIGNNARRLATRLFAWETIVESTFATYSTLVHLPGTNAGASRAEPDS